MTKFTKYNTNHKHDKDITHTYINLDVVKIIITAIIRPTLEYTATIKISHAKKHIG